MCPTRTAGCCRARSEKCTFGVGINAQKVTIPVNAMLFRQEGPRVAVVGSDGKVQLRPITIGRTTARRWKSWAAWSSRTG